MSGGLPLAWLLSGFGLGIAAGFDVFHTIFPMLFLLLFFLLTEKRHLGVALHRLPPVEFVHLVVGPRNYLSGLRAASSISSGGTLHNRGRHEGSTAGGGQIR